jgi:hypothetical protein
MVIAANMSPIQGELGRCRRSASAPQGGWVSHDALSMFSALGAACSGCGAPVVGWRLIWLGGDVPPRARRLRSWILRIVEGWRPRVTGADERD